MELKTTKIQGKQPRYFIDKLPGVFIPGNVPSSKNSKIKTARGIFHSKTVMKYLRSFGIKHFSPSRKVIEKYKTILMTFPVNELKELFKNVEYPVIVELHFIRGSKHKWDFHNACQIILDLLTAFDIIPDDNMDYIIPQCMFIKRKHYSYDKENAGILINIKYIR